MAVVAAMNFSHFLFGRFRWYRKLLGGEWVYWRDNWHQMYPEVPFIEKWAGEGRDGLFWIAERINEKPTPGITEGRKS